MKLVLLDFSKWRQSNFTVLYCYSDPIHSKINLSPFIPIYPHLSAGLALMLVPKFLKPD